MEVHSVTEEQRESSKVASTEQFDFVLIIELVLWKCHRTLISSSQLVHTKEELSLTANRKTLNYEQINLRLVSNN